ncbi:MAG TPA: DNA repair protein RadC [Flavobacteriales bacterium]|nr:DNA repair protein RadC [Flavobacteriales bacterium]HMR27511.1 DNA repair protein RadC [Flavobacteriales bacterium]
MADEQRSTPGRLTIREWASDDRPRERLLSHGAGALSDAELLAILIRSGTVRASALDLARQVLVLANNDLGRLGRLSVAQLMQVKGLGEAKAIGIAAALELGRRRRDASPEQRTRITTSAVAFELLHPLMADLMHEEFWLLLLDRGNAVTGKVRVSQGGMHGTVADPKVIFREAIDRRAAGVVLAHNHPSGRAIPSEEDVRLTRKLVDGGRLLDIAVHDHLIITATGYYSFADNGSL